MTPLTVTSWLAMRFAQRPQRPVRYTSPRVCPLAVLSSTFLAVKILRQDSLVTPPPGFGPSAGCYLMSQSGMSNLLYSIACLIHTQIFANQGF